MRTKARLAEADDTPERKPEPLTRERIQRAIGASRKVWVRVHMGPADVYSSMVENEIVPVLMDALAELEATDRAARMGRAA